MKRWASIILEVIPVIEFLVLQSNNINFSDSDEQTKVISLCDLAKKEASSLITHYGA
jgi:hypothetical protein